MASKIKKKINLALQGGGAHGAFTWGVLDRLLEDGRLEIEAISGTSAGAMNAVALADGLMENGREGARERLAMFWRALGDLFGRSQILLGHDPRFAVDPGRFDQVVVGLVPLLLANDRCHI